MRRHVQLVEINAQAGTQISLLIQINGKGTIACLGKTDCQVQSSCGFAIAALCISERECICHIVSSIRRNKLVPGAADGHLIQKQRV